MSALLQLSVNPLFEAIKPRPDDRRQFLVLVGYIGVSTDQTVTVYPELDLRTYLEIPRPEIIWAEQAVPGQASSPTKLVINAKAQVRRVESVGREVEAGYLSGTVTSTSLPVSAPGVTLNVSIENDILKPIPTCPGSIGGLQPHGMGGTTSNVKVTGMCADDGHHE